MAHRKYRKKSHCCMKNRLCFWLPGFLGVMIFMIIPFGDMVIRSFKNVMQTEFCGLQNYDTVFHNKAFWMAVKNTVAFVGAGLPLLIIVSLLFSLRLNKSRYGQKLKSAFLFPIAIPTVAIVLIWKLFFYKNGIINTFLLDIGGKSVDWLGSDAAFWVLIISYLWKNTGYTIVLWMSGMKNIPLSIMEAAKVDGANRWQCFRYITLPMLKPVLYMIVILSFLNSFKIFREDYLIAGAYPQEKMYLLQHLFNNWFTNLEIDKMSATAVIIAIIFAVGMLLMKRGLSWED